MDSVRKFHAEIIAFLESTANREAANLYKKNANVSAISTTALFRKIYGQAKADSPAAAAAKLNNADAKKSIGNARKPEVCNK